MSVNGAGPAVGTLLQRRYRVSARVASGGMGTVYQGWDERLDRGVAIKLLHPHLAEDDDVRSRFRSEARHAAKVRHPNVVAMLDQDDHDGIPFIVMELVDGPSLRAVLRRRTCLPPAELVTLMTAVCAGLTAVHDAGLVHRDIKPENLLYDTSGQVRVADFGIARALDSTRFTPTGTLLGSVQYIAPEVVLGGAATPATDQYALGIVAFETLTGRTPLPAEEPLAAALRHAREDVPPPSSLRPEIGADLDAVVLTATAKDPDHRHASLGAFVDGLRRAVDGAAVDRGRPLDNTDVLPTPDAVTRVTRGRPRQWRLFAPTRSPSDRERQATAPAHDRSPQPTTPAKDRPRQPAPSQNDRAPQRTPPANERPPQPATPPYDRAPQRTPPQNDRAPQRATAPDRGVRRHTPEAPPYERRRRTSALAIAALAFTLVEAGAVVAPVLGFLALRRIDRSHGALRGDAIAGLAIIFGLVRLAFGLFSLL